MATEVELKTGLTAKSLALSIPLAVFFAYMSVIVGLYTDKTSTFGTFIIPMVYFVVVMELLGRASPKLRLSGPEYVFIFSVFTFLGMHSYLTMHAATHNNPLSMMVYGALSDYEAFSIDSLRDYWSRAVPAVIIAPEPIRFEIATMLMNGRAPGQAIPWGYITNALVYWGLVYLFYAFISIFVTFVFGKVWIEEERLIFPLAVPSLYLFREASEVEPDTNKSRLFNFNITTTKIFWGMFVIGAISGIQPLIAELWPEFPASAWWGEQNLSLPFLAALWPGIYAAAIFFIPQIAVGLLMPNDALITLILGWIIFGVLYQGIGVNMGIVAYQSGMEYVWPWEAYPGVWMPFPYRYVASTGVGLGIAIWCLFTQRKRFVNVFSSLWKGGEERGISLRIIPLLLLIGAFGWYGLMLVEGADPLMALILPLWALIFNVLYARVYAEVFWHVGTGWGDGPAIWDPTYVIGSSLRGWPAPMSVGWDTPMTDPGWFTIARHISNMGHWNVSFSGLSAGNQITLYKLAYELKMRMKDFLIALIIGLIVLLFVFVPLETYFVFNTQGGVNQLGDRIFTWWPWIAAGHYHRGRWAGPAELTIEYALGICYGLGILLALILYILKTKVPIFWFISVPALYIAMTIPTYMWLTSLIALIIKFVVIRTIGIKKYEEYAMPIAAGWILGFAAMWLPAALLNLGVVFPKMQTLFQP
ncbi:MAG: DUF6785 family protein [Thermoproteota archaeon]